MPATLHEMRLPKAPLVPGGGEQSAGPDACGRRHGPSLSCNWPGDGAEPGEHERRARASLRAGASVKAAPQEAQQNAVAVELRMRAWSKPPLSPLFTLLSNRTSPVSA